MKKHCKTCGNEIKQKPVIYDDYFFCNKPDIPCVIKYMNT